MVSSYIKNEEVIASDFIWLQIHIVCCHHVAILFPPFMNGTIITICSRYTAGIQESLKESLV